MKLRDILVNKFFNAFLKTPTWIKSGDLVKCHCPKCLYKYHYKGKNTFKDNLVYIGEFVSGFYLEKFRK